MARSLLHLVSLVWLLVLPTALCALFDFDPDRSRYGALYFPGTVVVGDALYVDGGYFHHGYAAPLTQPYTLTIDLKSAWNLTTVKASSHVRQTTSGLAGKSLFYAPSSNSIYTFGGYDEITPVPLSWGKLQVMHLDQPNALWTNPVPPQPSNIHESTWGIAVRSPDAFYYLGGSRVLTDYIYNFPNLVIFNLTTKTWSNISADGYLNGTASSGSGVYLPTYGDQGILVIMGGESPPHDVNNVTDFYFTNMERVHIYDIANKKFLSQMTSSSTGSGPTGRDWFCTVAVQDSNSSGYDIFMYGGYPDFNPPTNHVSALSVWVLSIPSFHWTQLPESILIQGRQKHACEIIGKRQMAVVGGSAAIGGFPRYTEDELNPGPRIFDMAALKWSDGYDPNAAPYRRASLIAKRANNHPYPPRWDNAHVKTLFVRKSGPGTNTNDGSGTNIAAIAGGAAGGGLALLLLIGFVIWYVYRKNWRQTPQYSPGNEFGRAGEKQQSQTTSGKRSIFAKSPHRSPAYGTVSPITDPGRENESPQTLHYLSIPETTQDRHELSSETPASELAGSPGFWELQADIAYFKTSSGRTDSSTVPRLQESRTLIE